ncbi:MAG: hypothetical protein LC790_11960 [Actinobacteria bacterium]|nr:hypothetical protein [Actinomycetota bacterium]
MGNLIDYARVSTIDQDVSLQLDALEAASPTPKPRTRPAVPTWTSGTATMTR